MNKGSERAHSLTGEHERDEAVAAVDVRMHGWARVGSFALVVIADHQPRAQTASKRLILPQGENRSINGRCLRMQVLGGRSTPSDPGPWDRWRLSYTYLERLKALPRMSWNVADISRSPACSRVFDVQRGGLHPGTAAGSDWTMQILWRPVLHT